MECYVINLDRSIDNFYKQRPHLIESGVFPKRFSGIDAKKGGHLEYSEHLTDWCRDSCPNGAIGCGLSHILLAKKLYEKGSNLVLVLEDDAYPLVPDLNREIKKIIEDTPDDWDIIKLHCDFCKKKSNDATTGGSTAAYLINKSGLEKLSKMKLNWHIDLQWNMESTLKVYKSNENIFWADEKTSENRENVNFFGKDIFNSTGQKSVDDVLSFKAVKVFGYEISGWELITFSILLILIFLMNQFT